MHIFLQAIRLTNALTTVHLYGETQPVAPEYPCPPHWPYCATVPPVDAVVVTGGTLDVEETGGFTTVVTPGDAPQVKTDGPGMV